MTDENARIDGAEKSGAETLQSSPRETSKTTLPLSLWTFANSSFGIFLFSSILLGLVSFSYTRWQAYETDRRTIEQLDLEIALRLDAVDKMSRSDDNIRYSNLVNINDVIDGVVKSSFYVRKPIFNEFENKSVTTLMWQLYLLVSSNEKKEIRQYINIINEISERIRQIRYSAANDLDDTRPKPKSKKQQEIQDDEDDKFKKDYGQKRVYDLIHALAHVGRWNSLTLKTDGQAQ